MIRSWILPAALAGVVLPPPAAVAQTLGQSHEALTGSVGPGADARPSLHARRVIRTAGNLGGGFIELLVTGRDPTPRGRDAYVYAPEPQRRSHIQPLYAAIPPAAAEQRPARAIIDSRYLRQEVAYHGPHQPGTVIIDTPNRFLYLVQEGGVAVRYGIGVGRPGFTWAGAKAITRKAEWPSWTPPPEMLKRRPDLPRFMAGGPANPLGARALYLGSSLYRIHGTNEPETIGGAVSSGCIRMTNEDVIDLYGRVRVGTRVIVI